MRFHLWVACTIALAGCADSPTHPVEDVQPTPAAVEGSWRAHSVRGAALPAGMLVFDPYEEAGELKSIHFMADSAALVLLPGGEYQHRVWFSEWEGATGGLPGKLRYRWFHGDFGTWSRDGSALSFESGWIQNHRMAGSFDATARRLVVHHALGTDEEVAAFGYQR